MKHPKFSVVTLSFNQAEFLETAIRSVLEQDYAALQYIVVDPGSSDGSRDIIARYRDRIDTVVLEPDDGPADGLNRALSHATGELFAYINSDDAFLPHAFSQAALAFGKRPDADVIYGNGYFINAEGRLRRRFISDRYEIGQSVLGSAVVMQQASFFRLDAVRRVGGFVTENTTCWDGELLLDIALSGGKLVRAWRDWGLFRIHGGSISGQQVNHEAYRLDRARQFQKARGRAPEQRDGPARAMARAQKVLCDPRRTAALLVDRIGIKSGRVRRFEQT